MTCHIRDHKECSCAADECRAINLGHFTKPRIEDAIEGTFPAGQMIACAAAMFVVCFGMMVLL